MGAEMAREVDKAAEYRNASEHNSRSGQSFACFAALSVKQSEHYPEHYGEKTK